MKVNKLPADAGEYRGWKNSQLSHLNGFDRSFDDRLNAYLQEALHANTQQKMLALRTSSGALPRFDKALAAAFMVPTHLHGNFGLRFQGYAEECQMHKQPQRGRYMLALVCREFDIDRDRGAMIGEIQLLQIPCDQHSMGHLINFHDKVHYVLNQTPLADRPADRLMGSWLF